MTDKERWFRKLNSKHYYVIVLSLSLLIVSTLLVLLFPASRAVEDVSSVPYYIRLDYDDPVYGQLFTGDLGYQPSLYEWDEENSVAKYYMNSGGISSVISESFLLDYARYTMVIEMFLHEGVTVDTMGSSSYFGVQYDSTSIKFTTTPGFAGTSFTLFILAVDSIDSVSLFDQIVVTVTPHDGAASPIVANFDSNNMPYSIPWAKVNYIFSGDVPDSSTINSELIFSDQENVFGYSLVPPGLKYYIQNITSTNNNYFIYY